MLSTLGDKQDIQKKPLSLKLRGNGGRGSRMNVEDLENGEGIT